MSEETRRVADYAVRLRYEHLPPEVLEHAKNAIADSIGAMIYGYELPWSKMIARYAENVGAGGKSRILGPGSAAVKPAAAALVNGSLAHAFEMDGATKPSAGVHPCATIFPALLAIAQDRQRTDCEADGGFLNGKFGIDQIIIASNSTAVIPTIRNANAATSWSSQCLYRRMKIVPPLKNERGMNAALKTQQSLNLLLQAGHTRTRSEFVTFCCHPLVKVYLDLVKVYLEWRLSWPVCFMKCCCISALLHSLRASFSQQRR